MTKLGLIAGTGNLPYYILDYCKENDIEPYVVSFTTKFYIYCKFHNIKCIRGKLGEIGKIISFFKDNAVLGISMAGNMFVPDLSLLAPDQEGKKLLDRIKSAKYGGDNRMLVQVIDFFENDHQFKVMSLQNFLPKLLVGSTGLIVGSEPSQIILDDIKIGQEYLDMASKFDIGQAVVVRNQKIVAVEAEEGTRKMLLRAGCLNRSKAYGGVLVKMPKLEQNMKLDVPSIGLQTAKDAACAKLSAIAIKADGCFVIDKEQCIEYLKRKEISLLAL